MTNDTQITTAVSNDLAYVKHHLISFALVGVLALVTIFGVLTYVSKVRHEDFLQNQAVLATMQKQNEQTQEQTKAQIDALTQTNLALQSQMSALMSAITSRDAQLMKDRAEVKTLPPPQLATKWGEAANESAPSIDANGNFLAPLPLAQKSADALIQVPVLTKDNNYLKASLSLSQEMAKNSDAKFTAEVVAHAADKGVCTQQVNTLNAQVKDLKASSRKRAIIIAVVSALFGYVAHR